MASESMITHKGSAITASEPITAVATGQMLFQAPPLTQPLSSQAPRPQLQLHGPIYWFRSTFFERGLTQLPTPSDEVTAEQICSICLRRYSNDPSITRFTPSPTNSDDSILTPATKIKRCGHLFHRRCLEYCRDGRCPSCRTKLYKKSFWQWLSVVWKVWTANVELNALFSAPEYMAVYNEQSLVAGFMR